MTNDCNIAIPARLACAVAHSARQACEVYLMNVQQWLGKKGAAQTELARLGHPQGHAPESPPGDGGCMTPAVSPVPTLMTLSWSKLA